MWCSSAMQSLNFSIMFSFNFCRYTFRGLFKTYLKDVCEPTALAKNPDSEALEILTNFERGCKQVFESISQVSCGFVP